MPDGGSLVIATRNVELEASHGELPPGSWVLLSVRDTGTGMDEATRQHAFDPFFTTKPVGRGSGMGLASVFGIVAQHGGHLTLESTPGEGSTFEIYLPRVSVADLAVIAPAPEAASPPATEREIPPAIEPAVAALHVAVPGGARTPRRRRAPRRMPAVGPTIVAVPTDTVPTSSAGPTILIIEDDRALRTLMERIFTWNDYRVIAMPGGDEALALSDADLALVDLLVTDVVMPGSDGPTIARALEQRRPGLRQLFVSGYNQSAVLGKGLRAGTAYLAKPYTPDALLARVRFLLEEEVAAA
jgi:two-component system cell cycle sensor histidine kinase/response regulator CckA